MTDADGATFTVGSTTAGASSSTNAPTFASASDPPSSSGYLDDPSSSSSLAPTSLFSQLAQRQLDLSQAEYDDSSAWRSSSRRRKHRRRRRDSDHSSNSSTDSSHDRALQKEWDEQLDQLKLMFQIIIFPFAGKFFGRKFGYFLFNRYKTLGTPFAAAFWRGASSTA
ncbi:hypothetical protein PSEUBRA_000195 [Kalmanozyma brasiliensis GHG001]|uniref:uncharacterized protein n=1 Tax=Kalmanozyma brasiliensis (strain GHG001) TaxID=1365824 RepID=UPI002867C251|nr:uncharacterized protein PSEUBRA_000195 [Kalmanozyma brasiliensis GHG001]KAF6766786.1 hypothetical protein PSEUBRA_000195 [Kalmanozyma brasiliensis GHG001]